MMMTVTVAAVMMISISQQEMKKMESLTSHRCVVLFILKTHNSLLSFLLIVCTQRTSSLLNKILIEFYYSFEE
jgi:hypothetical protein